jgi:hypothetical protein
MEPVNVYPGLVKFPKFHCPSVKNGPVMVPGTSGPWQSPKLVMNAAHFEKGGGPPAAAVPEMLDLYLRGDLQGGRSGRSTP